MLSHSAELCKCRRFQFEYISMFRSLELVIDQGNLVVDSLLLSERPQPGQHNPEKALGC